MEKYARFRYQPCLPLGKDGRRVTASDKHIRLSKKAASEGIVLLKNNDTLPLTSENTVALFGKATIEYIKGGGGSGDVHCPYIRNIFDGFEIKENENKISVFKPLIEFYKEYVRKESVNVLTQEQINARWDIVILGDKAPAAWKSPDYKPLTYQDAKNSNQKDSKSKAKKTKEKKSKKQKSKSKKNK